MRKIPHLKKKLAGFKVTLPEADILYTIDGKKSISEIQSELHLKKLNTLRIINRCKKKGIIKITRRIKE